MKEQKKWTKDEIDCLIDSIESGLSIGEIALMLDRTEKSVRIKAQRLKIQLLDYKNKRQKVKFYAYQVICPFFESFLESKKITCEGVNDCSLISVMFFDSEKWNYHMNTYCCDNWSECLVAKMLQNKYEENSS